MKSAIKRLPIKDTVVLYVAAAERPVAMARVVEYMAAMHGALEATVRFHLRKLIKAGVLVRHDRHYVRRAPTVRTRAQEGRTAPAPCGKGVRCA